MTRIMKFWPVAALVAISAVLTAPVSAQERVTIGTGSTGGVYYPLGGGLAEIISKEVAGLSATAEVTGASIENSRRVGSGEMTLGIGNASTVYFAHSGTHSFKKKYPLVAIAALYPSTLQILARADSKIKAVDDLEDAKVAVGPPGGATRNMADIVFKAHGIADSLDLQFIDFTEATEALKDRNLDASVVLAGLPTPTIIDLSTTTDIRILPMNKAAIAKIHEEMPYYVGGVIPANTYRGQDQGVDTINVWNILFANKDYDQDKIYEITKAMFENIDKLRAIHPAANLIQPETAVNVPIPLAPGAARYYKEIGVLK